MPSRMKGFSLVEGGNSRPSVKFRGLRSATVALCVSAICSLAAGAWAIQQSPTPTAALPGTAAAENSKATSTGKESARAGAETSPVTDDPVTERKRQIAEQSSNLPKLAIDLKAEVDKSTNETLSVGVIRKAEAIEKLTREVKDRTERASGNRQGDR